MTNPTWEELVTLQPRLATLLADAAEANRRGLCGLMAWEAEHLGRLPVRRRLDELVGWFAHQQNSVLGTKEAYDVALARIGESLFPCRPGCSCEGY